MEERSPVTKDEKTDKQIDDKLDTPKESKSDNKQKIIRQNISKLTNLTQEIQSKLLEVETIEPSNPHIVEAKKLIVESSRFTQSSNVSQQSLLELVTRLERTRNSLANVITRSHSGKRDPENGQQIEKG